jgi:hypothetical protein
VNWKFWTWGRKRPAYTTFRIEYRPQGGLASITVDWPDSIKDEDLRVALASLIAGLSSGHLRFTLEKAVAIQAAKYAKPGIAEAVSHIVGECLSQDDMDDEYFDSPAVDPVNVFNLRDHP